MSLRNKILLIGYALAAVVFSADLVMALSFADVYSQKGVPMAFLIAIATIKAALMVVMVRSAVDKRWWELVLSIVALDALFARTSYEWFDASAASIWHSYNRRFDRLSEFDIAFQWLVVISFAIAFAIAASYFITQLRKRKLPKF